MTHIETSTEHFAEVVSITMRDEVVAKSFKEKVHVAVQKIEKTTASEK